MNHMGHPIASNLRDCYQNLCKIGKQNELPLIAGGGIGKHGNLAANAAALIMLGASAVQTGKYIMQAAAGCVGSEGDRCNVCNIGVCPKGITSQDPACTAAWTPRRSPSAWWTSSCPSTRDAQDPRSARALHRPAHRHVRRPWASRDKDVADRLQIRYCV